MFTDGKVWLAMGRVGPDVHYPNFLRRVHTGGHKPSAVRIMSHNNRVRVRFMQGPI